MDPVTLILIGLGFYAFSRGRPGASTTPPPPGTPPADRLRWTPAAGAIPRAGGWLYKRHREPDYPLGWHIHAGVDLMGPAGAPVVAPEAGTVVVSQSAPAPRERSSGRWSGYGPGVVVIQGESGIWHLLAHLDPTWRMDLYTRVVAGTQVGAIGSLPSGSNHVHWEARTRLYAPAGSKPWQMTVDPLAWLRGETINASPELVAERADPAAPAVVATLSFPAAPGAGVA